ncbi:MAG TPA: protein-L-isoaspartate O-methyltransferase [Rhodocyclaceae bacterium]|nr:protein-L-isoaspartate O-methyltransferase [Rhodocyclaceae bacterium]
MNFEQARFNMIEQQIRPWDVLDQTVLDLLFAVRREDFVPAERQRLAFADAEIPLGHGAVMLAPKIEAHALQAVQVKKHESVLEIGAGSGYMAALLAAHAAHVTTLEIVPELADMARANLKRAEIDNVTVETANGAGGFPAKAPFDVIVVSASVPELPQELLAQLKVGGRLFAIVGKEPVMEAQLVTREGEHAFHTETLFETVTAPLDKLVPTQKFTF